jgi:ubiquinone/menaquinone biosynthesis C-methylase UbiE
MRPNRNRVGALVERYVREFPIDDEIGVLDIGCGSGHQLLDLQRRLAKTHSKLRPCGIEISRNLAEAAHASVSAFGGHVAQASALDGLRSFGEMEFDVVMMISYLEHEFQPLAVLEEVRRILKPQGVCVLKVPNFASLNRRVRGKRWCGFRYPDHVNYFTPHTLRLVAAAAGLKVKRQAISDRFPLSDNMYAVLTRD